MLFAAGAVVGAIIIAFHAGPESLVKSATFHFGRGLAYGMINIYLVKTAAVFMITTSTIAIYTHLTPRWLAIGGHVIAVVLLIGSSYFSWGLLVFPLWVLFRDLSVLSKYGTARVFAEVVWLHLSGSEPPHRAASKLLHRD